MMKKISPFVIAGLILSLSGCTDDTPIETDFCPDNPDKNVPGVCGCDVEDSDLNHNNIPDCLEPDMDLCPDDPDKTMPGICGCGVADTDENSSTVPDCLETDMDLCPEDPEKTTPGICGCGVPDVDSDGDGVYVCHDACDDDSTKVQEGICGCGVADVDSDGDGTMDCQDACPKDANKIESGICGCGYLDEGDNIADSDGDGTPDCLDLCPDNPLKTEPGQGDCGWLDTDGDGVEDKDDACIYNPTITKSGVDCNIKQNNGTTIFEIWTAGDFETLKTELDKRTADGATPTDTYKIQLMRNIDLNEKYRIDTHDGKCMTDFVSIDLNHAEFDGKKHTVQFTQDKVRCALTKPIFNQVISSQIHDLNLNYDMNGRASAVLANEIKSSTVKNVGWNGDFVSGFSSIYGETGSSFSVIADNVHQSTLENIHQTGSIQALDMNYYGLVNYLDETKVTNVDIQISDLMLLKDSVSAFGYIGNLSEIDDISVSIDKLKVYSGSYLGVFQTMHDTISFDILNINMNDVDIISTGEYRQGELSLVTDTLTGKLSHLNINVGKLYSYEKVYGLMRQIEESASVENVELNLGEMLVKESIYGICYRNYGTIKNVKIQSTALESTVHSIYGAMYEQTSSGSIEDATLTFGNIKTMEAIYGFASSNYGTIKNYRINAEQLETISGNVNGLVSSTGEDSVIDKVDMMYQTVKASQTVYGIGVFMRGDVSNVSFYGDLYLKSDYDFSIMNRGVSESSYHNIVASMRVRQRNYDETTGNYTDLTLFNKPYCFERLDMGVAPVVNYYYRGDETQESVRFIEEGRTAADEFIAFQPTASEDVLNGIVAKLNTAEADVWTWAEVEEDGAKIKIPRLK